MPTECTRVVKKDHEEIPSEKAALEASIS
jgi:hypothetical protein